MLFLRHSLPCEAEMHPSLLRSTEDIFRRYLYLTPPSQLPSLIIHHLLLDVILSPRCLPRLDTILVGGQEATHPPRPPRPPLLGPLLPPPGAPFHRHPLNSLVPGELMPGRCPAMGWTSSRMSSPARFSTCPHLHRLPSPSFTVIWPVKASPRASPGIIQSSSQARRRPVASNMSSFARLPASIRRA